jgi:hypothetical protein
LGAMAYKSALGSGCSGCFIVRFVKQSCDHDA